MKESESGGRERGELKNDFAHSACFTGIYSYIRVNFRLESNKNVIFMSSNKEKHLEFRTSCFQKRIYISTNATRFFTGYYQH